MKNKLRIAGEYIIKHSKIVFPVALIAIVAFTVTFALNARKGKGAEGQDPGTATETTATEQMLNAAQQDVPLRENEDGSIFTVLATYYNAWALGDMDTIAGICDSISDTELLRMQQWSQYIDYFPTFEVYVKDGPEEGSTIAYVSYKVVFMNHEEEVPGYQAHYICTNEQGELYIKTSDNSDEVNDYILALQAQDDVVEFNNRINVEYKELLMANPDLLNYIEEVETDVSKSVGELLAQTEAGETQPAENPQEPPAEGGEAADTPEPEPAAPVTGPMYGTATTTVNVRTSDSEQADRLGKVAGGTQLEVLEQRANGWSKVVFEDKEGYIKSEYLQVTGAADSAAGSTGESADGAQTIGSVTATANINVRASASETAEKLGILAGGDTAELISEENGWCQIKYGSQVGYVKAEYVQK